LRKGGGPLGRWYLARLGLGEAFGKKRGDSLREKGIEKERGKRDGLQFRRRARRRSGKSNEESLLAKQVERNQGEGSKKLMAG